MYQKNIDKAESPFLATYEGMERRLLKKGPAQPFTLPPEAVLEKLIHALESKRPRVRYYVTFPAHLFAWLRRLLPDTMLDWVLARVSRGENK